MGRSVTPGNLDQRVTFQKITRTTDGMGGAQEAWGNISTRTSIATVWAAVRALRGREDVDSERVEATRHYLFTVRNRQDLSEANRIVWRGRNYNIRGIREQSPRDLYLVIEAEFGAAT